MDKQLEVVAALIRQGERLLICQRSAGKARALQWEFAGGKVEPGETKRQALVREIKEELGVTIRAGTEFLEVVHSYPDITIHLTVYNAAIIQGEPQKLEHNEIRWVRPEEAEQFDFSPADRFILEKIKKEHSHGERIDS